MMTVAIPTPRTARDDVTYTIALDGVEVAYRLRWLAELSGWYLTLLSPDGATVISEPHRIAPQARATHDPTAPGHPPGRIFCAGSGDGTRRDDLFDALELQYVSGGVS